MGKSNVCDFALDFVVVDYCIGYFGVRFYREFLFLLGESIGVFGWFAEILGCGP